MKPRPQLVAWMAVFVFLVVVMPGGAETFRPVPVADAPDHTTADGVCDSDPSPEVVTCTLRAAVQQASALSGPDVIELSNDVFTLSRAGLGSSNGDLDVNDDLRIVGVAGSVIDGGGIDRILDVDQAFLEVENVILRNGQNDTGSAAIWTDSSITLRGVEITSCLTGGVGGAISTGGGETTLVIIDRCWFHGNQAGGGGAVAVGPGVVAVIMNTTINGNHSSVGNGGGVRNHGQVSIVNSTISGNTCLGDGGGIWSHGDVKLASSTVSSNFCDLDANEAGSGCGIYIDSAATADVRNTIIADNLNWNSDVPVTEPDDCRGTFTSGGYNLIGYPGTACGGFSAGSNDLVGAPLLDPGLAGLGDNGGLGLTSMPEPSSPVVDAGAPAGCRGDLDGDWSSPPTLLTTEQRGFTRVLDDDGDGVARCTIGAIEMAIFADGFERGDLTLWGN